MEGASVAAILPPAEGQRSRTRLCSGECYPGGPVQLCASLLLGALCTNGQLAMKAALLSVEKDGFREGEPSGETVVSALLRRDVCFADLTQQRLEARISAQRFPVVVGSHLIGVDETMLHGLLQA